MLTINSKPLINDLTMAADRYKPLAPQIVQKIESRLFEVSTAFSFVLDLFLYAYSLRLVCFLYNVCRLWGIGYERIRKSRVSRSQLHSRTFIRSLGTFVPLFTVMNEKKDENSKRGVFKGWLYPRGYVVFYSGPCRSLQTKSCLFSTSWTPL